MSKKYDLHCHSTASDGTLTPQELIQHAALQEVDVLALTDHDTTAGLDEARVEANKHGIELINGLELSVSWNNQTLHIVALGIDPEYPALRDGLAQLQIYRQWRGEEIARRLESKANIPDVLAGVTALAKGKLLSRTHFARFLLQQGYVKGMQEAFTRYLKKGRPGFLSSQWADFEDGLKWIVDSGGQAVVAHPARYAMTATKRRRMLGEFKECGGVGLEVVCGSHSKDESFTMANLANQMGLLASVGSDYHGPENRWVELGRLAPLPDDCTAIWESWGLQQGRPMSGCPAELP